MNRPTHQKQTSCGFSLAELLMVCVMVMIVLSLSLKMMSGLRQSRQKATCVGNLQAIAVATFTYAHDHAGMLPGPVAGAQRPVVSSTTISPAHRASLADYLIRYIGIHSLTNTPQKVSLFMCPAAKDIVQQERQIQASEGRYYVHVASNQKLPLGYRSSHPSQLQQPLRLAGIDKPSSTILLMDLDSDLFASRGIDMPTSPAIAAHRTFRNVLYMDGHVEGTDLSRFYWEFNPAQMKIR